MLCSLVCLLDGYDLVVAPISIPSLSADWLIDPDKFAGALALGVLGTGIGAALLAPLGDRFGRRPLVLASFALVGVSSLLVPLASSVTDLAILRFVTGLGLGASLANALALTSEYALPHLRSRIVACVYAMAAAGSVLGGFMAPYILKLFGWEGLYALGGILPLLLIPVLYLGLAESRRFLELQASLDSGETPEKDTAAGASLHNLRQLLSFPFLPATVVVWLLFVVSTFAAYMIGNWMPTLMNLSGWSIDDSIRAVTMFSFGGIFGGLLLGWLIDSGRVRLGLLVGYGTAALALAAMHVTPSVMFVWMALITALGVGVIGTSYAIIAVAALVYPTNLRASGIGAAQALGRFIATLAPLVGGWLLANNFGALQILTGQIGPLSFSLAVVLLFGRRLDAVANQSSDTA